MDDRAARLARAMGRPRALRGRGAARRPEPHARVRGGRGVFRHPPDVGGRYAALTVVGMLPAALLGVNGRDLLERALAVDTDAARARGARLAEAALAGRDKLVLRPPAPVARLADWIEQLVAGSTGEDGRGGVPVVDDPITAPRADSPIVRDFAADPPPPRAGVLAVGDTPRGPVTPPGG